jgi:hypothetical protein
MVSFSCSVLMFRNDLSLDEGDRRNREQVHRGDRFPVIAEKGKPAPGRIWISGRPFQRAQRFFVISHERRRILHFNVTKHPTSLWIVQQLREAFPFGSAPRFIIFDRDAKYGLEVPAAVRSLRVNPVRTSFESPWQNGVAERWVGSCRRDLLDHEHISGLSNLVGKIEWFGRIFLGAFRGH